MKIIDKIILMGAALLFLFALSSYFATPWFLPELFSHYQMQLFICGAIIFILLLLARKSPPIVYILVTAALTLNGINLLPYANFQRLKLGPQSNTITIEKPGTYTLLQANVFKFNFDYQLFIEMIRDLDPDIFVIFEMTPEWQQEFESLTDIWPNYHALPENGSHGIGLYSKYPLSHTQIVEMSDEDIPALLSRISMNGQTLQMIAIHPRPPVNQSFFENRNQHFEWLQDNIAEFSKGSLLVVGDLNTTMFAPHYKQLIRATGLKNAREGRGLQNSWFIYGNRLTGIPIDHFLYNDHVSVVHSQRTPEIKSDHLPILTYFKIENRP